MATRAAVIALVAACGGRGTGSLPDQAVGTDIGGGSMIVGPDDCKYTGSPGVFVEGDKPKDGPRFVRGPGKITVTCPKTTLEVEALVPTAARISGPSETGKTSDLFQASLYAGDRELDGQPRLEWTLGKDCDGLATFGPVLGSQDTGGRSRSRTLVTSGKGTCTVIATLTTGDSNDPSFPAKSFQAEKLVTIK